MNHYPHHIGDFDKATRHLSRIERSIYRDLIELYYDTEEPLTLDRKSLCRRILAKSNEEATAVEQMLNEFFNETPTGWFHSRCDTEIEKYRNNSSAAAKAGRASAAARALKAQQMFNGCSTDVERSVNEIQPTGNREPGTVNREAEPETKEKAKSKDLSPPSASTNGTRLSADWQLPKAWGEWALTEKPNWTAADVRRVADDFKDHWLSNANQAKAKKADWHATWRKWVRSPLNEIKSPKSQNVQEARLDTARQIFGGQNGTNRQAFDIDAIRTIEGDGESVSKVIPRIR